MIPLDVTPDVQKQIISELEILFQVPITNECFNLYLINYSNLLKIMHVSSVPYLDMLKSLLVL